MIQRGEVWWAAVDKRRPVVVVQTDRLNRTAINWILAVPLILLIWAIDFYLFTASLRLILGQLSVTKSSVFCRALRELVDPIPAGVDDWLNAWRHGPKPRWVSWAIEIGVGRVARYFLITYIVSVCQTQT